MEREEGSLALSCEKPSTEFHTATHQNITLFTCSIHNHQHIFFPHNNPTLAKGLKFSNPGLEKDVSQSPPFLEKKKKKGTQTPENPWNTFTTGLPNQTGSSPVHSGATTYVPELPVR